MLSVKLIDLLFSSLSRVNETEVSSEENSFTRVLLYSTRDSLTYSSFCCDYSRVWVLKQAAKNKLKSLAGIFRAASGSTFEFRTQTQRHSDFQWFVAVVFIIR